MIGHSSPTLEDLPYIPIRLNNRIISCPTGRGVGALSSPPTATTENLDGGDGHGPGSRESFRLFEPSSPRRWAPDRVRIRSARAGVCLLTAAMMLGLALWSGWLARASAQEPR